MHGAGWIRQAATAALGVALGVGAMTACGGSSARALTLPNCAQLGAALPGKPALTYVNGVSSHSAPATSPMATRFPHDLYVLCRGSGGLEADVYLLGTDDRGMPTATRYPDGKSHDGVWRAQYMYSQWTARFQTASLGSHGVASFRYGSAGYVDVTCTEIAVDGNAVVSVVSPLQPSQHADWQAACSAAGTANLPGALSTL